MKKLLFLVCLFFSVLLKGQTDFTPGYVIKQPGDTVYGEIDYRDDLIMGKICRF